MAAATVGTLIKEARTQAHLTQEQLARKISGLSAADIGKAERGEKQLTQAQLREIAKATGVTQASLINAAKASNGKTSGNSGKTSASSATSMKVTATEKRLLTLYREADSQRKKAAMSILRGDSATTDSMIQSLLENAVDVLTGKK